MNILVLPCFDRMLLRGYLRMILVEVNPCVRPNEEYAVIRSVETPIRGDHGLPFAPKPASGKLKKFLIPLSNGGHQ